MDRNQAKELLPIIKAFSEGKVILVKDKRLLDEEDNWDETDDCSFNIVEFDYRIKPSPTYRPFANAEECWQEMLKHQPFGWVKNINENKRLFNISLFDPNTEDDCIYVHGIWTTFEDMFSTYTFADGSAFGVKVEE